MTALHWLLFANTVLWIGLGSYAVFLGSRQSRLQQRLEAPETPHD